MKHMENMNEAVGMKNCLTMGGGGKQIVCPLICQEFYKCICYVLLAVTYGKKGHKIWSEIPKYFCRMVPTKLQRNVHRSTDLYKVCWYHYRPFSIYDCYLIIIS